MRADVSAEIAFFHQLNDSETPVSRAERQLHIRRVFPSAAHLNWDRVFTQDVALMGRLIRDILKIQVGETGKPGPRGPLPVREGLEQFRRLLGEDYSLAPFSDAFEQLRRGRSMRSLAARLQMSKSHIQRLLAGDVSPSLDEMQRIASAFGKHPSYFLEWRSAAVATAVSRVLEDAPEASVVAYRQLVSGL